MKTSFDVIVIGGGASGMMAAGRAAERGLSVLLLEKNKRLGEKVRISGGGRCNITNAETEVRTLLKKYGAAEKFLYSAFAQFGVEDTFRFFTDRGLPLVVQAGKRAFPETESAADVVAVLERYLKHGGVTQKCATPVERLERTGESISAVWASGVRYTARAFICATGSYSRPETGSTGDGFLWLAEGGHTIVSPTPTLVPLRVSETWIKNNAGLTLPDAKVTFFVNKKKKLVVQGAVLCTHFGISGPLILNVAKTVADMLHEGAVTATIDLFPGHDHGALDAFVVGCFAAHSNKSLKNSLKDIVGAGVNKGVAHLAQAFMVLDTAVNAVRKEERKQLITLLKAMPVTIEGLMGFDKAVIADGGIPLTEIDMRTMASRKVVNLFVTGDLLHINRPSGGYSLQLCWTTGWVAGSAV